MFPVQEILISGKLENAFMIRKPGFRVSDQGQHKPACTATETGLKLKILDLTRRVVEHAMKQKQSC